MISLPSIIALSPPFILSGTGPPRDVPTALHGDWEDLATDPDPEWALWEDV